MWKVIAQELTNGAILALILGFVGYARVFIFQILQKEFTVIFLWESLAIAISLLCIVFCSVALGLFLPLFLQFIKVDPAHAGPTVQVVTDILGVVIICAVCTILLK